MEPVCIVHLSDLHLFDEPDGALWDVPTQPPLVAILDRIRTEFADCRRIVLTGDVTHEAGEPAHQRLAAILGDLLPRCRAIPGNHDDRQWLSRLFPSSGWRAPAGRLVFQEFLFGWHLVGLDSLVPGQDGGRLGQEQLDWLAGALVEHGAAPTLLFVHHPPITTGSPWLDGMGLADADSLAAILSRAPQVRLICAGHGHQELSGRLGHADVLVTPATCVQFRPRTSMPERDDLPPGFRILRLDATTYSTQVVRLPMARGGR